MINLKILQVKTMTIKINTAKIDTSATKIDTYNSKMRDDFSDVVDAIAVLNRNWDGGASDNVIYAFNKLKSTHCDRRFSVINNLVTFLRNRVSTDYQRTETNIKENAKAFK